MNPVWGSTLGVAIVAAGAWLLVWPLAGPEWAWAAAAAILALRISYHARHLASFLAWLERPARDTLPVGSGIWEEAFARLHQHLKKRDDEQQGLLRALGRFRAAGRALPDGVVILDAEDHIEWSNPTAERHFGIDARRDFGQTITNLVRQPDFVAYLERHEYLEPLTLRSARSDAALSVRVIEFGAEQKLLMSRDVTIEQRLETMRRDFVANVSHELKTPVTVLSGFVDTLADESIELSSAQRKRFLALMDEQARRMRRLIEDLLTLSALESGGAPEDEQAIEIRPFVEKLGEEARALSGGRHRIIVLVERDCRLTGSAEELKSAFSNLVSNAVRYTPQGGTVQLFWRIEDGRGVFGVQDNGIGIETRHIARLTERFYRVDSSRSRETGGTGLGLAIVKHVLTRHQAMLDVRSELGRGSTFSAVFPPQRVALPGQARAAA
ncbi:MAG TPA: phosphate regulon sensor histidine kinase PhoR [Burkholderiales bacterium]|nr:phosphate regulon sensor histidine kinase PhoR [Burkholderiales bacterium]